MLYYLKSSENSTFCKEVSHTKASTCINQTLTSLNRFLNNIRYSLSLSKRSSGNIKVETKNVKPIAFWLLALNLDKRTQRSRDRKIYYSKCSVLINSFE